MRIRPLVFILDPPTRSHIIIHNVILDRVVLNDDASCHKVGAMELIQSSCVAAFCGAVKISHNITHSIHSTKSLSSNEVSAFTYSHLHFHFHVI